MPIEVWECPEPVGDVRGVGGNNSVELSWSAPANADVVELTNYFVQVVSSQRIVTVDPGSTSVVVSGLRNGVEESFVVYAASERGRSEASEFVTATPSSGMDGEVAGLIVKFTDPDSINAGDAVVPGGDKVTSVALSVDAKLTESVHLVELSEAISAEQATEVAAELQSDPGVQWAEPDVFVFPSARFEVDDPQVQDRQWNLWDEFGVGIGQPSHSSTANTSSTAVNASVDPDAGAGTVVAVIDTGITPHPDLDSQLVPGFDFVSNPDHLAAPRTPGGPAVDFDGDDQPGRDGDPTDPGDWRGVAPVRHSTWHGTHVAGVIAAQANNGEGIIGVAPGAKILPVRALSWRGGLMSDIISSITWASGGTVDGAPANTHPADVITLSFTATTQCSVALQSAIDDATTRGSILVAAAGNANDDVANYAPANCREVIAVAATGRDGKRAPYSNHGPGIDISAPGGSLLTDGGVHSTSNTGLQHPETPTYRSGEGTSIAAAHVAGAIARVKSDEPDLTTAQLRARFLNGEQVRAFPDDQCDTDPNINCGTGLLTLVQVASWPPGITNFSGGSWGDVNLDCRQITATNTFYNGATSSGSWITVTNLPDCSVVVSNATLSGNRYTLNGTTSNPGSLAFTRTSNGHTLTIIWGKAPPAPVGPSLSPASQTRSVHVNTAMTATSALTSSGFSSTPTYTISPALPAGLTMNASNGVISGTPTAVRAATQHTITGTAGAQTATATVTITVLAPSLSPATQTLASRVNQSMTASQSLTANGFTSTPTYSISPALPAGLTMNTSTGVISGTPTEVKSATTHTITGTSSNETATATVIITVNPPPTEIFPGLLLIQGAPNHVIEVDCNAADGFRPYYVPFTSGADTLRVEGLSSCISKSHNRHNTGITPTGNCSGGGFNPSICGAGLYNLNSGLLNSASLYRNTQYQVLNTGAGNIALGFDIIFYLALGATAAGTPEIFSPTSQTITGSKGVGISRTLAITAANFSAVPTYSISPALPTGLTLDPVTGVISGTPTSTQPATVHTLTATNGAQSATATVTVTVRLYQVTYVRGDSADGPTPGPPWTSGSSPAATTTEPGEQVTLPTLTRDGWNFQGWFTAATGGTRVGGAGDPYAPTSSITLYAQWTDDRYAITYDIQGGSGAPPIQRVNPGESLVLPSGPTRTGFIFDGWATSAGDPSTRIGNAGASYTPTASITLFALWAPSFTVTYDRRAGSGTPASTIVAQGGSLALPSATRTSWTLMGWFDAPTGGTRVGGSGDSFTPTSNMTLYAQWAYRIQFRLINGWTSGLGPTPPDMFVGGDAGSATFVLPTATRDSHRFLGWWSAFSGGTKRGDAGQNFTATGNLTMHAQWLQERRVDFDPVGGVINDSNCEMLSAGQCRLWWATGDPALRLPNNPEPYNGLTFDGWFNSTSSSGGTFLGFGGATLGPVTQNVTYRAQWTGTRTYDANGGAAIAPVTAKTGTWATIPTPYRPGFAFVHWLAANPPIGPTPVNRASTNFQMSRTETWTAQWQQFPDAPALTGATLSDDRRTIRVRFSGPVQSLNPFLSTVCTGDFAVKSDDATFNSTTGRSCAIDGSDVTITKPAGLHEDVTELTVAYIGRYLAAADDSNVFVHQSGDITVRGAVRNFTVRFDGNGIIANLPVVTVDAGEDIPLPDLRRPGFVFLGWFESRTEGLPIGLPGESFTPTVDVTLYAQWRAVPPEPPRVSGPTLPPVLLPIAPPRLDVRPPRIETPVVSRPDVRRPAVVLIDDEEVELVIERDEQNTGLDATIGDFVLSVGATDTARNRIAPTERRSLVAPVRGWIDVKATGYAPRSVVGLYLVPQMAPRFLPRFGFEPFFLGEAVVDDDRLISGEFRIPDWAAAGEYALQINGFTAAGALKSINMRLDLIDQRADAVSAARACVFPESTVRLTPECRRSLRSLKDLLPDEIDTLTIDITGVAYAQENRRANRAVALERAERIRQFLRRNDIGGDVTVGVVVRRNMTPGLSLLPPPPVVVAENGKPASTVVLTVEWTTEVGPDGASLR